MRTFLSIPIPDAHADALAATTRKLPKGRDVDPDMMHVTALFLGDPPEVHLEDLHDALDAMRIALPPLTLGEFGHFGHAAPRVAWVSVAPVEPLTDLHDRLTRRAHGAGIRLDRQRYVPHVTLARYRRDSLMPDELAMAYGRLGRLSLDAFQPTELQLMASHLGEKGPRYEVLSSYPVFPT